jgi:hypothetical protein
VSIPRFFRIPNVFKIVCSQFDNNNKKKKKKKKNKRKKKKKKKRKKKKKKKKNLQAYVKPFGSYTSSANCASY